jgi:hypothetical protein
MLVLFSALPGSGGGSQAVPLVRWRPAGRRDFG